MTKEITAIKLHEWLDDKELTQKPILIDVRERWEHQTANIETAKLIPMNEIVSEMASLDKSETYVCFCHHGMRSMKVALFLENNGFDKVFNLTGGIDAWSQSVDPAVPTY